MRRQGAPERFLATVLFVDIVGSTEVAARLGDRAWRELLADFYALARRELRRTGGRELDTAGDGMFAAFEAPGQALACATGIARRISELGLEVRCGVHVGEVERIGSKVGGIAVHIGARVAGRASPGEILVTTTVRELATGSAFGFEDRGEHELKGVAGRWRLHAVAADAAALGARPAERGGRPVMPMRRRRRPFWTRHPRLTTAVAVVAVFAVAGGAYLFISAPRVLSGVDPDSVGLIDAGRGGVIGQVEVGSQPSDLAFGHGSLWVSNTGVDTVSRVDPESLSTVDTIQVGADPEGIAVGFDAVWVANSGSGTVSQINPESNTVVRSIGTGNGPTDVAVAADSVWVANLVDGTVQQISPETGEVAAAIAVGATPAALAADTRSVWVANRDAGAVTRVDIATGQAAESVNVGSAPSAIALGAGALWVANAGDSTVSRIDVESRRVIATIVVPPQPSGIAIARDAVWVASGLDGSVSRIDPATGSVQTIRAVSSPERVTADADGRIWFTTRASTASHRGGTLRVAYPSDVPPAVDPALAYSTEEWWIVNAAYNGLVTYAHVAGARGSLLVPNLAESIPTPADGGTTYIFRVREGIHYSDGTTVGPADFRHAIERGFELPATADEANAPIFYGGIVGASECADAIGTDADCDLSEGIEIDEGQRTVTFRLTEPDADFLYKLAMPFSYAVPVGVPGEPLSTAIPANGPYMIADATDTSVRLVRNPEFEVWSPEARPDGFPDEIAWEIDDEEDAAIERVIAAEADVLAGRPPPERVADLRTRHTNQVHVRPAATLFVALDTTKPPFDDIRVRQAVSFALDRQRVVELLGGEAQASPTCQVIPPNFHGYRRFCPYTIDPGPAGVWTGPDRRRAVELVAESGAAGAEVNVWTLDRPQLRPVGEHLVDVLSDIGLEPSLTAVTDEEFLAEAYSTAPDREPVAIVIGWFPDYPAASTFIEPNFSCDLATNLSRYCDPALEERMREARELQGTDPAAAGEIWADIDREVTEAAAWAPVVTFNETYFVSERVGNVQLHVQWGMLLDQLWVE